MQACVHAGGWRVTLHLFVVGVCVMYTCSACIGGSLSYCTDVLMYVVCTALLQGVLALAQRLAPPPSPSAQYGDGSRRLGGGISDLARLAEQAGPLLEKLRPGLTYTGEKAGQSYSAGELAGLTFLGELAGRCGHGCLLRNCDCVSI